MTTKSKTRKAPAAKSIAPEPSLKETAGAEKTAADNIRTLVLRWRFLDADRKYQEAIETDNTVEPFSRHRNLHVQEQDQIKSKLSKLVPKTFEEIDLVLDFATAAISAKIESRISDNPELKMLKNARKGIIFAESKEWACNAVEKVTAIDAAKRKLIEIDAT